VGRQRRSARGWAAGGEREREGAPPLSVARVAELACSDQLHMCTRAGTSPPENICQPTVRRRTAKKSVVIPGGARSQGERPQPGRKARRGALAPPSARGRGKVLSRVSVVAHA